jgi:hypothetical protein
VLELCIDPPARIYANTLAVSYLLQEVFANAYIAAAITTAAAAIANRFLRHGSVPDRPWSV